MARSWRAGRCGGVQGGAVGALKGPAGCGWRIHGRIAQEHSESGEDTMPRMKVQQYMLSSQHG